MHRESPLSDAGHLHSDSFQSKSEAVFALFLSKQFLVISVLFHLSLDLLQ